MTAGTDGTVLRWMPPLVVDGRRDRRGAAGLRRRRQSHGLISTIRACPGSTPPACRAWRDLQSVAAELERVIDDELTAEWDVPLGWFDVLAALQRLGGSARPSDLAVELRLVRSSLSRRLDRLEEEGWVASAAARQPRRPSGGRRPADPPRPRAVARDERDLPAGRAGPRVVAPRRLRRRRPARGSSAILAAVDDATSAVRPVRGRAAGTQTRAMTTAVIVDAVRTPLGKRNGKLKDWHPVDLAAETLKALVDRTGIDPGIVDDVVMGCVMQVGEQGVNIARNAVLAAGWPEAVPGTTVDRQCGSSQQAAHFAAQGVIAGAYDVVVAGGRRGDDPRADGRVDGRRQVRLPVRAQGRGPLRRPGRPRAAGHLGRADRREVEHLPRGPGRLRRPAASSSPPRATARGPLRARDPAGARRRRGA